MKTFFKNLLIAAVITVWAVVFIALLTKALFGSAPSPLWICVGLVYVALSMATIVTLAQETTDSSE